MPLLFDQSTRELLRMANDLPLSVAIAAICTPALIAYWRMKNSKSMRDEGSVSNRRMSFTSAMLAHGSFPPDTNFEPTVINLLLSFKDIHDCVKEEDMPQIVERLLKVARMSSIPTKDARSSLNWRFVACPNIDPKRMTRTVDVHCDTLDEIADEVHKLRTYSLRCENRNLPWWEFCVIRNKGKSESMLVLRVDHTIGDGLSLGRLVSGIVTKADGSKVEDFIPASMRLRKNETEKKMFSSFRMMLKIIPAMVNTALAPMAPRDHSIAFAKNVVGHGKDTRNRKIIIFDSIPLAFVKAIQKKASVTFNDVIVSALSQSIYDYCKDSNCPLIKKHGVNLRCRTAMTVGFPQSQDVHIDDAICNRWWVELGLLS